MSSYKFGLVCAGTLAGVIAMETAGRKTKGVRPSQVLTAAATWTIDKFHNLDRFSSWLYNGILTDIGYSIRDLTYTTCRLVTSPFESKVVWWSLGFPLVVVSLTGVGCAIIVAIDAISHQEDLWKNLGDFTGAVLKATFEPVTRTHIETSHHTSTTVHQSTSFNRF